MCWLFLLNYCILSGFNNKMSKCIFNKHNNYYIHLKSVNDITNMYLMFNYNTAYTLHLKTYVNCEAQLLFLTMTLFGSRLYTEMRFISL